MQVILSWRATQNTSSFLKVWNWTGKWYGTGIQYTTHSGQQRTPSCWWAVSYYYLLARALDRVMSTYLSLMWCFGFCRTRFTAIVSLTKSGVNMCSLPTNVADPDPYVGFLDPDPAALVRAEVRIRILLSSSKNSKKNLHSDCLVTSLWLFIFEKLCHWSETLLLTNFTQKMVVGFNSVVSPDTDPHWIGFPGSGSVQYGIGNADPDTGARKLTKINK